MYTYHYIVRKFSDQQWKRFDHLFSCALQLSLRLGISHTSLKKAFSLGFCWDKYVFIQLLPVYYHCASIVCCGL